MTDAKLEFQRIRDALANGLTDEAFEIADLAMNALVKQDTNAWLDRLNDIARRCDLFIDNAATASQNASLLDDEVTREAIRLNVFAPMLSELQTALTGTVQPVAVARDLAEEIGMKVEALLSEERHGAFIGLHQVRAIQEIEARIRSALAPATMAVEPIGYVSDYGLSQLAKRAHHYSLAVSKGSEKEFGNPIFAAASQSEDGKS